VIDSGRATDSGSVRSAAGPSETSGVSQTNSVSQTIKALIVRAPGEVALAARPAPAAAPGEVLVRPDLVGLCGTDLEIIAGQVDPAFVRYPIGLGHEWTGIVTGDSALAGTRVVVEGVVACGHCARCARGETNLCETYDEFGFTRDGAAAGLVTVPAALVHPLEENVAADDAVLTEPASVVYQGLTRAAISPGARVLVIGDGTIALLAVYLLRLWSPAEVVLLGQRPAGGAGQPGRRCPFRGVAGGSGCGPRPSNRGGGRRRGNGGRADGRPARRNCAAARLAAARADRRARRRRRRQQ
jgi:Alcohol dehydrogenase GroES-like domain